MTNPTGRAEMSYFIAPVGFVVFGGFIMSKPTKIWQDADNSIWLTRENLLCNNCNKRIKTAIEVKDIGIFCWECFNKYLLSFFEDNDKSLDIRQIIDIDFCTKKQNKKQERELMTYKLRYTIIKRDNFRCVACGSSDNLEIDHIIPIVDGGRTIPENLQTLCYKCNHGKGVMV